MSLSILRALTARRVRLSIADGENLRVNAPAGTMTDQDWLWLASNKESMLAMLRTHDEAAATVRILFPALLGTVPLTLWDVIDSLGHHTGNLSVGIDAAKLRQALLVLTHTREWPPSENAIELALAGFSECNLKVDRTPKGPLGGKATSWKE